MVDITKKAILVALLLISCKQEKEIEQKKYFDLKKLSTSIIQELKLEKPRVEKHWQIGSKKESKTTNDIDWEKELSLFLDADLNKSAYLNSYKISEKAGTKTYILKSGERLPVKKMVITEKPNKLSTEIYVKTNTSNYLFETSSDLSLIIKNRKLESYSVYTIQKLFLSKADTSQIKGIIKSL